MRRRVRLAAILAILAVAGTAAALLTTPSASAFPPGTCNGTSCTGSKTDAFTGVSVCRPGTSVYWEDSYLPADVTNVRLAKFAVMPSPPCTGATVGALRWDPWPASPKDPDGTTPPGEPGKKPFRFRWTLTVPQGSTSNGTMTVAWTLDWTKASGGGVTETTPGGPCPTSGFLPAHCRYDLEVSISAPDYFSADRVGIVKLKVIVYNNGPARSPTLNQDDGHMRFHGNFATDRGSHAIQPIGPSRCDVSDVAVFCPVQSLEPHGEETFAVGIRWNAGSKRLFDELRKRQKVFLELEALVFNPDCDVQETSCNNNHARETTATR